MPHRPSPPQMDFNCADPAAWSAALSSYPAALAALKNPSLTALDSFYRTDLPPALRRCGFLAAPDLRRLMEWKLSRGKHRPRLLAFVSALTDSAVESASRKAFAALPDLARAVGELTVLKGVGPATASAVLAAYAPDVAPFMSDEAMVAALGNSKEYTLKQYLAFAAKLQNKAKELSTKGDPFTPSDVERALWSSAVSSKLKDCPSADGSKANAMINNKRKRKP